eukprot:361873-Chlamydomonas_euryale.AAC.3
MAVQAWGLERSPLLGETVPLAPSPRGELALSRSASAPIDRGWCRVPVRGRRRCGAVAACPPWVATPGRVCLSLSETIWLNQLQPYG